MSERARSFETVADEYERHRPEYPDGALRWIADRLGLVPGERVLDLGAGTGKLSRGLLALGLDVVAVEPGAPMLAQLRAALPGVEAVEGAAEAIPLPDASVDAAAAGQAYHWFDPSRAPAELWRVLRPDGGIALVWNWWDVRHSLQRRLCELLWGEVIADVAHEPPAPQLFEPLGKTIVESVLRTTPEALVARIATTSSVLTAEPNRRDELLGRMRELADRFGEELDLPQLTFVYLYRRVS